MKKYYITIESDKLENMSEFQRFLDTDRTAQMLSFHVSINNNFEDLQEYLDM